MTMDVYFCSASRNQSQRSHTHFKVCRLTYCLAHIDLYIPIRSSFNKIGIPSSLSSSTDKLKAKVVLQKLLLSVCCSMSVVPFHNSGILHGKE